MREDGTVVIGTDLTTNKFEEKLEKLEKKHQNEEVDLNLRLGDVENAKEELKKTYRQLAEIKKKRDEINKQASDVQLRYASINDKIRGGEAISPEEYSVFGSLENKLTGITAKQQQVNAEFDKYNAKVNKAVDKLAKVEARYDKQKQKVQETKNEIAKVNAEIERNKVNEMSRAFENVGKSVQGVTKNVKKWALAIFGIRSAYLFIRQAMSTLAGENEQIATDIEYIKWVIAQMLLPVVQAVIKGAYIILGIINSIVQSIVGINLLGGKSADAFKKAKKSTGGMAGDLKEAKKQLAGFDEMNVLQDTTPTSGGGGGTPTGWEAPDFSEYENKFKELKSKWLEFGESMRQTIEDMPFSVWVKAFGEWALAVRGVTEFVYGLWEIVTGVIQFIKGILEIIVGLVTGDTDKIKQGVIDMLDGLWKIIDGLIHAVIGIVETLVGVVIGVVVAILKGAWELLKGVGQWIYDKIIKPIADFFVGLWNGIINGVKNAVKWVKDTFNSIVSFFSGIISTILGFFKTIGTKVGDAIGGAFKSVINGVLGAIESILNFPIRSINKLINVINKVPGINLGKLSTFNLPRLAKGGIINMPGPGVMVGSAVAGERGREGVIPLTDSQQMALLGEAIGKYVTINANITNTMNGRVISKELQKIQNDSDFAYNR